MVPKANRLAMERLGGYKRAVEPAGLEGEGEGVGVRTEAKAAHPDKEEEGVKGGGEEGVGPDDCVVGEG